MQTTSRYALQNLYFDRDQIYTLVATYALSPSSYGEHHLLPVFTSFACSGYRYGSDSYRNQGMEKDDEAKGSGNSYDFGARMYDSRLGRWWNINPVLKPHRSPYDVLSNSPIIMVDPKGDDDNRGFIRSATESHYNDNFLKGLLVDVSAVILNEFTPIGAIDDAISVSRDKEATISDNIRAWVPILLTTRGGGKVQGTKAPTYVQKGDVIDIDKFKPKKGYKLEKDIGKNSGVNGHGGHRNVDGGSAYKLKKDGEKLHSLDKTGKIIKDYKK